MGIIIPVQPPIVFLLSRLDFEITFAQKRRASLRENQKTPDL
jgi:hypothetical protein